MPWANTYIFSSILQIAYSPKNVEWPIKFIDSNLFIIIFLFVYLSIYSVCCTLCWTRETEFCVCLYLMYAQTDIMIELLDEKYA